MEVQMPRAELDSLSRRDRRLVRQLPVGVAEYLQRARILLRRRRRLVAARDEDHVAVSRHHALLRRIDARVDGAGLRDFAADRAVAVERVDRYAAGIVVGDEQMPRLAVTGDVDGSSAQRRRLAFRLQIAVAVHAKRRDAMLIAARLDPSTSPV